MTERTEHQAIADVLSRLPFVRLGLLFGSLAEGHATPESDVDLAIAGERPLTAAQVSSVIAEVSVLTGRPVDVVDLLSAGGRILQQAVTKGKPIYVPDRSLYARVITRMWFNQSDWMPIHRRILAERRERWISDRE